MKFSEYLGGGEYGSECVVGIKDDSIQKSQFRFIFSSVSLNSHLFEVVHIQHQTIIWMTSSNLKISTTPLAQSSAIDTITNS